MLEGERLLAHALTHILTRIALIEVKVVFHIVLHNPKCCSPAHPLGYRHNARRQKVLEPVVLLLVHPSVQQVYLIPPFLFSFRFEGIDPLLLHFTLPLKVLNHYLVLVEVDDFSHVPLSVHIEVHVLSKLQLQEPVVEYLIIILDLLVESMVP